MAPAKIVEIDLTDIRSKDELHAYLQKAFGFPSWYGRDWDAFWDSITGLVEMPEQLIIHGLSELKTNLPGDAKQLERCLSEMAAMYPNAASTVVYR